MRNIILPMLTLALAYGFSATPNMAHAQTLAQVHQQMENRFKKADVNGDGKLTRAEARNGAMRRVDFGFNQIDTKKRGYVTLPQLKAAVTKRFQ